MKAPTYLVVLVLAGCGLPRYTAVPVAFQDPPPMSFEQARAICAPRAQAAASSGPAVGTNCTTARVGTQLQTTCGPATPTYGATVAAHQAGDAAFAGCLAEHGWRLERRCAANCAS